MEIWKDVTWYEWKYQISNLWNTRNLNYNKSGESKLLKPQYNSWYTYINIRINKKHKQHKIHRLVAQRFIPNLENKPFINHINWIRDDNRVENLEWCTPSENTRHSYRVLWNVSYFKNHFNKTWLGKFWKLHHNSKKVNQYDLDGNFIKTWDSIQDIYRWLWIYWGNISSCCLWKLKTTWWYKWQFFTI